VFLRKEKGFRSADFAIGAEETACIPHRDGCAIDEQADPYPEEMEQGAGAESLQWRSSGAGNAFSAH